MQAAAGANRSRPASRRQLVRLTDRRFCIALSVLAWTVSPPMAAAQSRAVLSETGFKFGRVLTGAVVEHEFALKNEGSAPLRILRVQLTSPLVVTRMPAFVAAGTEATIKVRMDTSGLRGHFPGEIQVFLDDPALPEADLQFVGDIVPLVEVAPAPAFFLAGRRGESRQASLEIINHESEPLKIDDVSHPSDSFTTQLEQLEEGQRYRLTLFLKPDGPGGRHSDTIVLRTSSRSEPTITVLANTYLHERVYPFPDTIDFGTISLSDIERNPELLQTLVQTLMVYQFGGTDFTVTVHTDVPQLHVKSERGPQRDRYQNSLTLIREKLTIGTIRGSLFIETNDAQHPSLKVPVSGVIVP
jgi:hypothetical protein